MEIRALSRNREENNILLAEDDREIRQGIEIFLRGQGYKVFQAADGLEGLAILEREEKTMPNLHVYASLGVRRYLSLMRYACFVLGNSSSGLMEAPAFHIPTVNIGDRQKGRLRTEGVIDCGEDAPSIIQAVRLALSDAFREKCGKAENP